VHGTNGSDQITILGNDGYKASGVTHVWGGGGQDFFFLHTTPGDQADHFHYTSLSDSPAGGGRDTIDNFDTDWDIIDLTGLGIDHWEVNNIGGVDVFQAFQNWTPGDTTADLEIALPGLVGIMNHNIGAPNVLL
jgi:hypothetical protein